MATKRRKKHKNNISEFVIAMCYNRQKAKFSLFTNPSRTIKWLKDSENIPLQFFPQKAQL